MIANAQLDWPEAWCDIHLDRISANLERALEMVPDGRRFCAVLKADAYGHGIAQVVPRVMEQGVVSIGITSNAEARAVRAAGFNGTLIRLRAATRDEIEGALPHRVEEQVGSLQAAQAMQAIRRSGQGAAEVHLALNCKGMSRDGLEIGDSAGHENAARILEMLGDQIVGICTHFPRNHPDDLHQTDRWFQDQVDWVLAHSLLRRDTLTVHAGSSLTLLSGVPVETDMYRCGAILYGILRHDLGFRATLSLKTRVVSLGRYSEGQTVGYDRDYVLSCDSQLACLSIGYANGIPRIAQGRIAAMIRGQKAPILGKISMNTLVADVTEIDSIQIGDEAVLFNHHEPVTAFETPFGSILADLFTDWGARNPRLYF